MVPTTLGHALDLMSPGGTFVGGGDVLDPKVGSDAAEPLGAVTVTGVGGGLPAAYPIQVVTIYADRATITPGLHEVDLPLTSMRVVAGRPTGFRWSQRKAVDAMWSIDTRGADMLLTFRGRWPLLAQLGSLGGWSEPT